MADSAQAGPSCMERMRNLPWRFVLRSLAGAAGVCITVLGFVSIFTISAFSIKNFISYVYQVIFGILTILSELRLFMLLRRFSFLASYTGLGAFYFFVGGLALGDAWYEVVLAIVFCFVGLMYLYMGICMRLSIEGRERIDAARAQSASAPAAAPAAGDPARDRTASSAFPETRAAPPPPAEMKPVAAPPVPLRQGAPAKMEESAWPEDNV